MPKTQAIELDKLSRTFAAKVLSMLDELEGATSGRQNREPQWPTRFITYQKVAPLKDKGDRK